MKRKLFFQDSWDDGHYLDRWTLVHFLSGVLIGYACYFLQLNTWLALVTLVVALFLWELFEYGIGIIDYLTNLILDTILGIVGFAISYFLLAHLELITNKYICGVVGLINLLLAGRGWLTWWLKYRPSLRRYLKQKENN